MAIDNAIRLAEDISRGSACLHRAGGPGLSRRLGPFRRRGRVRVRRGGGAAAARTAATVWLMLNPGEGDRDAGRWLSPLSLPPRERYGRYRRVECAFTAAVEAVDAVVFDDTFMRGAIRDYETLLGLHLGADPQAGRLYRPLARWAARAALSAADMVPGNSSRYGQTASVNINMRSAGVVLE